MKEDKPTRENQGGEWLQLKRKLVSVVPEIRKTTLFLLGVAVGYIEWLFNAGKQHGDTTMCTPFWDYCNGLHWFWDLVWGSIVVLGVIYLLLGRVEREALEKRYGNTE